MAPAVVLSGVAVWHPRWPTVVRGVRARTVDSCGPHPWISGGGSAQVG
jgi:hypothetical protein